MKMVYLVSLPMRWVLEKHYRQYQYVSFSTKHVTLLTDQFLGYLRYMQDIKGPHLVVVPKSTLDNWKREFERWTPEVNVLVLQGAKDDRAALIDERLLSNDFDVCITSYEMVMREKSHLKKFPWEYIIVDEVHFMGSGHQCLKEG